MNNTILSAKNSFLEGLIMDFSPELTLAGCLTNALNATLLTFNGNEMALQNDMGNARVETARLPDGYIPVGTCEFGDIIYIVSYNPLTNKSLIGCFPSPERNISSEEIGGLEQTLSASDFQELYKDSAGELKATGKLKATSVKKILMEKSLNPGDKFIIYDKSGNIRKELYITDVGNTDHDYGKFPKLLKIHVVAIEDSGKINYLDSSLKWYEKTEIDSENLTYHDFFILDLVSNKDSNKPDIDSYRNLLSSGYSVFQSKVSGKLALLIELEKISGFSLTYDVYKNGTIDKTDPNITYNNFDVYWNLSWTTDNELINPSLLVYEKDSEWTNKKVTYGISSTDSKKLELNLEDPTLQSEILISRTYMPEDYSKSYEEFKEIKLERNYDKIFVFRNNGIPDTGYICYDVQGNLKKSEDKLESIAINDDVVNNCYKLAIYKKYGTFQIPSIYTNGNTKYDLSKQDMIYNYKVIPCMPYGMLEDLAVEGSINFGKIGTGEINLTLWRYYNTDSISTITLGLEAYVEANKGISGVVLEFYDNLGIAAALHIENRNSYSGVITEQIPLNGSFLNFKMKTVDSEGKEFVHAGLLLEEFLEGCVYFTANKKPEKAEKPLDTTAYYQNDAGTLYPNYLYGVKIIIKYTTVDALGLLDTTNKNDYKIYNVWYWTSNMYNDYYYNTYDFSTLNLNLNLDVGVLYEVDNDYSERLFEYKDETNHVLNEGWKGLYWRNLRANVQSISGGIKTKCDVGLLNTYGMFSLNTSIKDSLNLQMGLGKNYITYSNENPVMKLLNDGYYNSLQEMLPHKADYSTENKNTLAYTENNWSSNFYNLLRDKKDPVKTGRELWSSEEEKDEDSQEVSNYKIYQDLIKVEFPTTTATLSEDPKVPEITTYLGYNGEIVEFSDVIWLGINADALPNISDKSPKLKIELQHFSKYIPIYEEVEKYVDVVKPILYDENDLLKYNIEAVEGSGGASWFLPRRIVYFSMSDWHDDVDMLGHRFFSVRDANGVDSFDISGKLVAQGVFRRLYRQTLYSQLKVKTDTYWLDKATDEDDKAIYDLVGAYPLTLDTEIFPEGFSILITRNPFFGNGVNNVYEWHTDDVPSMEFTFKSMAGSNIKAKPNTNLGTTSINNGVPGATIVYRGSLDSAAHILNLWVCGYDEGKNTGIRNFLRSLMLYTVATLAQIYKVDSVESCKIKILKNILYLDLYETIYTLDILFKTELTEASILHLNYYGSSFDTYINKVKDNFIDPTTQKPTINDLSIFIGNTLKNIPIQFKLNYIEPDFLEETDEIKTIIKHPIAEIDEVYDENRNVIDYKITRNSPVYSNIKYEKDQLYYMLGENLTKLNLDFRPSIYRIGIRWVKGNLVFPKNENNKFGLPGSRPIEDYEKPSVTHIDYNKILKYENDRLYLKLQNPTSYSDMYLLVNDREQDSYLQHLFLNEAFSEDYVAFTK